MAAKGKVVLVRATVERAVPDRTQFKMFSTELTFGGNLEIEIEVPAEEVVEQKGGKTVLTAAGYASLLGAYVIEIEKINNKVTQDIYKPNNYK